MTILFAGLLALALLFWARDSRQYRGTIANLTARIKFLADDRDKIYAEYNGLKDKIVERAAPKKEEKPKRYSGPQLRTMNDRLNAKLSSELQERPNSEILKEQVNG